MDALFYLIGALVGVTIFGEGYDIFKPLYSGKLSGSMGVVQLPTLLGISAGVIGFVILVVALLGFWGAEWVEKKWGNKIES